MKIFYWLADNQGVGYYRGMLPAHALANLGHQVQYHEQMPEWVKDPGGVDVIVAQRTCMEGASTTWQRLAKAGHHKLVLELDDDLWTIDPANRQAAGFYDPAKLRRLEVNIEIADLVTVTTDTLADRVSAWNSNVAVLPNCIPGWLLDEPMPVQGEDVTIGWAGGASHSRDFGEAARPLKRILQRFGAPVEFHCMGVDYTDRCRSHRGRTRFSDWQPVTADYLKAIDFHIGLAPLRPSTFNDAKSDLKLLELAALGIPAIVSDTGPYARAVAAGAPALTASTHKEWEARLVELVQSPSDRETLGKDAREWASTRTIEANAYLWSNAYAS